MTFSPYAESLWTLRLGGGSPDEQSRLILLLGRPT
jgi:hypothetical protein